tara:strand:- start:28 stop:162 length:135 start_codon:yes stop_codon:yes gene_type:complete
MCFTRKKHFQKKYIKVKSNKIYPEQNVFQGEPEQKNNKDKKEQN